MTPSTHHALVSLLGLAALCSCNTFEAVHEDRSCTFQRDRDVAHDEVWNGVTPGAILDEVDGLVGPWRVGSYDPTGDTLTDQVGTLVATVTALEGPGEYHTYDDETGEVCDDRPYLAMPIVLDLASPETDWSFSGETLLLYDSLFEAWGSFERGTDHPVPTLAAVQIGASPVTDPLIADACSDDLRLGVRGFEALQGELEAHCPDGTIQKLAGGVWNYTE